MTTRLTVAFLGIATLIAAPAFGDDLDASHSATVAVKPHPIAKKLKPAATDPTSQSLDQIRFSQPNASPIAPQKNASPSPRPGVAAKEPQGGLSLDMKWRASNDKVDPYDAVRHSSGPGGSGDAVQGGIKLGF
jgi:hypothetical protein